MKRFFLFASLGLVACQHDRDLKICEYNPGYCADGSTDADAVSSETDLDTGSIPDVELDSTTDSASTDLDTGSSSDAAPDSTPTDGGADSSGTDTSIADSTVADSTVADTTVADTTVADSTVADTTVADSSVADTFVADTATDTCVCTPGVTVPVTGSCYGVLEKKTKTCTSSCTWGPETCAIPKGWTKIADPPSGFEGRIGGASAWTGGELFVHGGTPTMEGSAPFANGAYYQLATNTWKLLPTLNAPAARTSHTCVFDGGSLICWGGRNDATYYADGYKYEPLFDRWTKLASPSLAGRFAHVSVWATTTKELLVWGGVGSTYYADGAAFDPAAGTWTALPTAPIAARGSAFGAWTGTELLIWGGRDGSGTFTDGALYNPSTKTWRKLPSGKLGGLPGMLAGLVGSQLVTFGGVDTSIRWQGESAALGALTWSDLPSLSSSLLEPRVFPVSWAVGSRWFLWSGYKDDGTGGVLFLPDGATYDSVSKTWSAMPTADAPLPRIFAITQTIAQGAIVWSGLGKPGGGILQNLRDGAVFVP